jgi:hypothetical protein
MYPASGFEVLQILCPMLKFLKELFCHVMFYTVLGSGCHNVRFYFESSIKEYVAELTYACLQCHCKGMMWRAGPKNALQTCECAPNLCSVVTFYTTVFYVPQVG